jgi:2-oxoglutarate dehydrogenase E2 component (dihydrolipoamide succinyltransferase)
MTVTVSMPQLGESVTEGTVTRWLKKEGERVEADEPLLEVSTDKVDTEIPSPASGILRGITVAEDETVAVGAQLAIIDDAADGAGAPPGGQTAEPAPAPAAAQQPPGGAAPGAPGGPEPGGYPYAVAEPAPPPPEYAQPAAAYQAPAAAEPQYRPPVPEYSAPYGQVPEAGYPAAVAEPGYAAPPAEGYAPQQAYAPPVTPVEQAPAQQAPAQQAPAQQAPAQQAPAQQAPVEQAPVPEAVPAPREPAPSFTAPAQPGAPAEQDAQAGTAEGPYITPLVRKLAAEHGVNLATVAGTGVGGRIRKQDVLEAARVLREQPAPAQAPAAADGQQAGPAAAAAPAAPGRPIVESTLRGTTERLSRARQLIARRMVESLQTSAQLTTVVEADVTAITRLRARAKADFEAREGVKLSYLPFFALATLEALKVHPKLNAVLNTEAGQIIYHDAEHLGIAVDTERGLMVPVIRNAGDLNIGGLARKIADLAGRTRAGQVGPDELAGGTFTLTNTGSRGALFDTPIINQPQVAILGTGTVVKRPVVMEDPALGEVITVRSMVYLALTYDHRLIDGADAARFLATIKERLEEGAFEAELGL